MEWTSLDKMFLNCAIGGAVLLIIRVTLQLIGADADTDLDGLDGHDTDIGIFIVHGITSFFTMFGIVGLACTRQAQWSGTIAIIVAFGAGMIMMILVARIFLAMYKLESSGNIDIKNAIGVSGVVYLRVPADGSGQVTITIQRRTRTYDARSANASEIPSGERIVVVDVLDGNILSVKRIEE